MSARPDGAFGACMQFAAEHASIWVPQWLFQLNAAVHQQEGAARSFNEKQALGRARTVLASYREEVTGRLLDEIASLVREAETSDGPPLVSCKPKPFSLDDLSLVEHGQVQEKVDLSRMQQVVKRAAEEATPNLNALLSSACGLESARDDVNPLLPDAVVSAVARVLAGLHMDEGVRSVWMQAGAAPLGNELTLLYSAMAEFLLQRGIEPVGYVLVQQTAASKLVRSVPLEHGECDGPDSVALTAMPGYGAQMTLAHLHRLLAANFRESEVRRVTGGRLSPGLAFSLAAEVVALMMLRMANEPHLLPSVRDLVQGLRKGLMLLATEEPHFFADPCNAAQQLLNAIAREGSVFCSEQEPGFVEFFERTRRVVAALQSVDSGWPARLRASLKRFPPSENPLQTGKDAALRTIAACGTQARDGRSEDAPTDFMDTLPLDCLGGMPKAYRSTLSGLA